MKLPDLRKALRALSLPPAPMPDLETVANVVRSKVSWSFPSEFERREFSPLASDVGKVGLDRDTGKTYVLVGIDMEMGEHPRAIWLEKLAI